MSPDRWQQTDSLFAAALELQPRQRAALLDQACDRDSELRRMVEELLRAEESSRGFLSEPAALAASEAPLAELAGQRVGSYRLLEPIGEGGMGAVFLATRDDDDCDRRVAVKLIRSGFESREIRDRFRAERRILAGLEHANVARLYDAGTTGDGRLFLVMEYVRGVPIDRYCDQQRLTIEDRIRLFLQVLSAVQHAHRSLLVHRDLKPENVLVDAGGQVKLLDFGIAKVLDSPREIDRSITRTGQRPMSPAYASPEQVRGEPVTTACDIYSVGVMLYELLAGCDPYRLEGRANHELERAISEQTPEKPSVAVKACSSKAVAEARRLQPGGLRRRLAGDLDNIVMRALEKTARKRYDSVADMAEDLRRHLEGLPVAARPATLGYRLAKFVGRHRWMLAAATAFLVLGASYVHSYVTQARQVVLERDKAQRVTDFLIDMFEVSREDEDFASRVRVKPLLDVAAQSVSAEPGTESHVRAAMLDAMGRVYSNVGLYREGSELLEQGLALRREILGPRHPETADSLEHLAETAGWMGDYPRAWSLAAEAHEIRVAALGEQHPSIASTLKLQGLVRRMTQDLAAAEKLFRQALALQRKNLGNSHREVAATLVDLADVVITLNEFEQGKALLLEALDMRTELLGGDHPEVTSTIGELAGLNMILGHLEESEGYLRDVLRRQRTLLGDQHPLTMRASNQLAVSLIWQGKLAEAESLVREALEIQRRLTPGDHPEVATHLANLAIILGRVGDPGAEAVFRRSLDMQLRLGGDRQASLVITRNVFAQMLHDQGRLREAEELYRQAIASAEGLPPPGNCTVEPRAGLGRLLLEQGKLESAASTLRGALAELRQIWPPGHWRIARTESDLGRYLVLRRRFGEAEDLLSRSYADLLSQKGPHDALTQRARARLIELHVAAGRPEMAPEHESRRPRPADPAD